jgi:hypothetical protein
MICVLSDTILLWMCSNSVLALQATTFDKLLAVIFLHKIQANSLFLYGNVQGVHNLFAPCEKYEYLAILGHNLSSHLTCGIPMMTCGIPTMLCGNPTIQKKVHFQCEFYSIWT